MATYHDIERLEAELMADPSSVDRRERLLFAYAEDDRTLSDPRRFAHIRWFIRHHPAHRVTASPLAHPDPRRHPEAYRAVVDAWREALAAHPDDLAVARAAALLIALDRPEDGRTLLRRVLDGAPDAAEVWIDLGRICEDPGERVAAFQRARSLGSRAPNLLVWTAQAAVLAGDLDAADALCGELEALVDESRRACGSALDWPETGRALWARARERTGDDDAALELVQAISDHAYRRHWLHTVHGLIAAELGDARAAVAHLHAAATVNPDFRLRAAGPSLDLARRLYDLGHASDVVEYLRTWERQWDDERIHLWLAQAQRGDRPGGP
ncbi:MAG: tetratricopeptide repeat protein [Vicinamibacterales bacterium]